MFYVYILQSLSNPTQTYSGYTSNLNHRLITHNSGKNIHTAKFIPWKIIIYLAFENKEKAIEFEQFLKTGSGNVFAKKRLI